MIVVSDTSPIINLAAIGRLELLRDLYGHVIVPEAVYHEVTVRGHGQPGALELQTWPWFEMRRVLDIALVSHLERELDAGEAEAIALALEMGADMLLLDERRGRAVAARFSLPVTGLLGALVVAKHQGHLPAVKPVLDDLITVAGFWIGDALYTAVVQSVGET